MCLIIPGINEFGFRQIMTGVSQQVLDVSPYPFLRCFEGRSLDAAETLAEARTMAADFSVPQEDFCARLLQRIATLTSQQPK